MKVYLKEIREHYPEFEIRNYDEDAFFTAFNHDSRNISENDLFVPIVGEKFDGHDYILDALTHGASVSLCESSRCGELQNINKPLILADSVEEGLEKILNYAISPIKVPVIAVTGSTGKTTTKKMIVKILQSNMKVLSDDHSNTVWGNAALLSKYVDEKAVVLECAMDRPGEIAWHVNSVDPDIGILLNTGHVHSEKLGGIEGVFKEKKDLADYMERTGKPLILNIDDERLHSIKDGYNKESELVTFGKNKEADFVISDISVDENGTHFYFSYYDNTIPVNLKVFGEGYAYNAMAAIIAANLLQVSMEDCVKYVEEFEGGNGRFEKLEYGDNLVIINDAYNANPISMDMSIKTFGSMYDENEYHRIVILGDMGELGNISEQEHKELGELVKSYNFDEVYYVGEMFKSFGLGESIGSADEVAALLNEKLGTLKGKKVAVLLKGSNVIGLYQIPDFLKKLGIVN